ncbi:MAG: cation transporter [Oscillospiraceae bacterium]|jgi:divalent metal cation (Fe/Co/Zn/Cd) transporter|nr:cation transporter [Oscillospiraceae bacterium]
MNSMAENDENIVDALQKQEKVALFQLIAEMPNLVALITLAVMSGSLILTVDALGSVTLMIQAWIVFVISKKLAKNKSYEYDYGMGKFESFGGFIANILLQIGLVAVLFSSIFVLFEPSSPSEILLYAIALKLVNTSVDVWLYIKQKKVSKMMSGKLVEAENHLMVENLAFDLISLTAIVIMYVFREGIFVVYFEPVLCIIYALYMICSIIKPLKQCAYDLLDKTMDEDIQLKIMKAMAAGYKYYDSFESVRTRSSGQKIYIDLLVGFDDNKTYIQIKNAFIELEKLVKKEVPNSIVSFVIKK